MDNAASRRYGFVDDCRNPPMVRRVVALYETLPIGWRERARGLRPDTPIGQRAIEVDEQPAYRRRRERGVQRAGKIARHDERARVVTAVAVQDMLPSAKKASVLRRNAITAMFAGYHEEIAHADRIRESHCGRVTRQARVAR